MYVLTGIDWPTLYPVEVLFSWEQSPGLASRIVPRVRRALTRIIGAFRGYVEADEETEISLDFILALVLPWKT